MYMLLTITQTKCKKMTSAASQNHLLNTAVPWGCPVTTPHRRGTLPLHTRHFKFVNAQRHSNAQLPVK